MNDNRIRHTAIIHIAGSMLRLRGEETLRPNDFCGLLGQALISSACLEALILVRLVSLLTLRLIQDSQTSN